KVTEPRSSSGIRSSRPSVTERAAVDKVIANTKSSSTRSSSRRPGGSDRSITMNERRFDQSLLASDCYRDLRRPCQRPCDQSQDGLAALGSARVPCAEPSHY